MCSNSSLYNFLGGVTQFTAISIMLHLWFLLEVHLYLIHRLNK